MNKKKSEKNSKYFNISFRVIKNTKKSKIIKNYKVSKNNFFFQSIWKFWQYIFFAEKKAFYLTIEEISLWPELSSPPCFRIQWGYPECDTGAGAAAAVVAGLYFCFLI